MRRTRDGLGTGWAPLFAAAAVVAVVAGPVAAVDAAGAVDAVVAVSSGVDAVGTLDVVAALDAAAAQAQARWRLSAEPTLTIGSIDGPAPETFHDVRGVVSPVEDVIVVADGGSQALRVFSGSGTFLREFGRSGNGPREFRDIDWIDTCGGPSIVAFDGFRHRITKWDTDGTLLAELVVQGPRDDLPPYDVRCGPSGEYAVIAWPDMTKRPAARGPYRLDVLIGIADERGRLERVVGAFPGTERMRTTSNDRPHPFGRVTFAALGPGGLYVGTADSFAIERITPDGERRTFGRDVPVEPLSAEERELWVDAYVRRAPPEQRARLKRGVLDSGWVPDVTPAYQALLIDRLGFVWVSPYVIGDPNSDAPVEWSVFDAGGAFVATVLVPGRFRPMEIGGEHVLGVSTDGSGVERVHRYALSR